MCLYLKKEINRKGEGGRDRQEDSHMKIRRGREGERRELVRNRKRMRMRERKEERKRETKRERKRERKREEREKERGERDR